MTPRLQAASKIICQRVANALVMLFRNVHHVNQACQLVCSNNSSGILFKVLTTLKMWIVDSLVVRYPCKILPPFRRKVLSESSVCK